MLDQDPIGSGVYADFGTREVLLLKHIDGAGRDAFNAVHRIMRELSFVS
jgi:hypothetical protein